MEQKKKKAYLTTIEAAEVLLVSTETVRTWAQKGKLKAQVTPGGHRRFFIEDIEHFANSMGIDINARSAGRQPKILIVDDDDSTRKLISKFLNKKFNNVLVDTAANGFEAGQKIISFRPDAVILDIMMPGVSGADVCRLIRSNAESKNINIIAITGQYTDDNVSMIINAGANMCLGKPVEFDKLVDALNLGAEASVGDAR